MTTVVLQPAASKCVAFKASVFSCVVMFKVFSCIVLFKVFCCSVLFSVFSCFTALGAVGDGLEMKFVKQLIHKLILLGGLGPGIPGSTITVEQGSIIHLDQGTTITVALGSTITVTRGRQKQRFSVRQKP